MIVNNLKELETELRKRVQNALATNVDGVVKEIMQEHIILDVYDAYDPVVYARKLNSIRYNNSGPIDEDNIVSNLNGDLSLSVKSVTLDDKYIGIHKYNKSEGYTSVPTVRHNYNKPIAGVIETGQGYDIEGWEYNGVQHSFMINTCEYLKDNHYHTTALKEGLRLQGLEVK